ncbi:MAG: hypothetical protein H8E44_05845 [Planctomycetes bacterium]|nr:hypothetical protein [Planctomycetota bacterium]MBL7041193.1 hypothetical protein [Pirellulaceae bacterium]
MDVPRQAQPVLRTASSGNGVDQSGGTEPAVKTAKGPKDVPKFKCHKYKHGSVDYGLLKYKMDKFDSSASPAKQRWTYTAYPCSP